MKVRMLKEWHGPTWNHGVGSEVEVSAEVGAQLMRGGAAELMRAQREVATTPVVERAERATKGRRRKK